MHFYMRNAKSEDIESFKRNHKMKSLGMPEFISSGSQDINSINHRFVVLPRFGKDISKIFKEQNNKFPLHTVYRLGIQCLNVLQYVHERSYVHMDIKASNILLGVGKGGDEQTYLLDFGLACHCNTKEFKPDPKKMHNGTIEYTSRDAHQGVPTMRGDIEVLSYNLIEWAGAQLPWVTKKLLAKPVEVHKSKEEFMKTPDQSLKNSFGSMPFPSHLATFFKYLVTMKHDTEPDYEKIQAIFEAGIKAAGGKNSGPLEFSGAKASAKVPQGPNFSDKRDGTTPRKIPVSVAPKEASPPKRARAAPARNYQEVVSESSEEEIFQKKKPAAKKKPTPKKKPAPPAKSPSIPPTESSEEAEVRPAKRNRQSKSYAVEAASDDEAETPTPVRKSPKKKARVEQPTTSKENHNSPESSASPPPKKAKNDGKKGKSSKKEDAAGASTSTLILKSNSKDPKNKKTLTLNFNLDVSMSSDVVFVVNRKDKKKKDDEKKKEGEKEEVNSTYSENDPMCNNRAGFYKGKAAKSK